MTAAEPRTIAQFYRWLETACDNVDFQARYVDPDYFDRLEIEQNVDQASRIARRLGAGDLAPPTGSVTTIDEALAALGRLLAWARGQTATPPSLLSVGEVAEMIGVSTRSVWRMVSAGEIPSPVKVGGTKWRRTDIEAMIDLLPSKKG